MASTRRFTLVATSLVAELLVAAALVTGLPGAPPTAHADSFVELTPPAGSSAFGFASLVLANGNYVIADPYFDLPGAADAGAVYLYDGRTDQIISTLTGSSPADTIGIALQPVGSSDFIVLSRYWTNGAATSAGAVTWVDGSSGLNGQVSAANSLVGSQSNDLISSTTVILPNGHYVTGSPYWDNGGTVDAGALAWGNGNGGTVGVVTAANSLVGTTAQDQVGLGAFALTNGNYVVGSWLWRTGGVAVGAATWGNGAGGTVGAVSVGNSLIGGHTGDEVGAVIKPLTNGNYVVQASAWDDGATANVGAVTWRAGNGPGPGIVSSVNSLVGTTAGDGVGEVTTLSNGNYVASSRLWDDGVVANSGAVTWGDGLNGTSGTVTIANSFVGGKPGDGLDMSVVALSNGNYVILDRTWDLGATVDVGAVTWRPGNGPTAGSPSAGVSLIGSVANDRIGQFVLPLVNGNYVVSSTYWHNGGIVGAGAATWGRGTGGVSGAVSTANSLVGSSPNDSVGSRLLALANGHYVVSSPGFDVGAMTDAGAITWRPGDAAAPTTVTAQNSVLGSSPSDLIGFQASLALPNGDYVIGSPYWDNGGVNDVGAVRRFSGGGPTTDSLSAANSLVGTSQEDYVGEEQSLTMLSDGTYAVVVQQWNNGGISNAGAVTWASTGNVTGPVTALNSTVGTAPNAGNQLVIAPGGLTARRALLVARRAANQASLIVPSEFTPLTPARLADTRPGSPTVDGVGAGGGPVAAGSTLVVQVEGRGGLANDVPAAALNVTAVGARGSGFVTVYPCGEPRPLASSLNFTAGSIVPNAVLAKLGADGTVCLFTSQTTDLVVDVNGSFPLQSSYRPVNPARLLDTRGEPTVDGLQQGGGKLGMGGIVTLQVAGRAGVQADARSVALNVTVTEPDGPGFVTVFPCGEPRPLASSLNFVAGSVVANLVVSKIGAAGTVCLFASNSTHLVADLNGYHPARTAHGSVSPARLLETRPDLSTVDGESNSIGFRARGTVTSVRITGRAGVPVGAGTAVLNVTATEAAGPGFVTVYPCGIETPLASNLNYVAGSTVPNAVLVKIGADGQVCLFNSEATHLVVDITGFIPAG